MYPLPPPPDEYADVLGVTCGWIYDADGGGEYVDGAEVTAAGVTAAGVTAAGVAGGEYDETFIAGALMAGSDVVANDGDGAFAPLDILPKYEFPPAKPPLDCPASGDHLVGPYDFFTTSFDADIAEVLGVESLFTLPYELLLSVELGAGVVGDDQEGVVVSGGALAYDDPYENGVDAPLPADIPDRYEFPPAKPDMDVFLGDHLEGS